jgi:alkylation response protein AidB-like acyl-CoA dehydrogenase
MTAVLPSRSAERELAELIGGSPAFGTAALAALDAAERFPDECCALLDRAGLHHYYVPARHGGRMGTVVDLLRLLRTVAGRDLTVAVGHGKTLLGTASVWTGGSAEQASTVAGEVLDGAVVSWALTERHHGSDLLAGEVTATRTDRGWRLDGEKWLINNATRGDHVCVLARTSPDGGGRGFSVFLVDKRVLPPTQYLCLPKARTHGIRGADISGIAFHGTELPETALIGAEGEGLEIVLKALQLTRTVCTALSLGAGDHALRITAGFVAGRELYGRRLIQLPHAQRMLGDGAAALLRAEVVSIVAARAASTLPAELSVISAVAKASVPTLTQRALDGFAELLGARGFLTGVLADGMFAKVERDHRVVGIFDGSTLVNRSALIDQFAALVRGWWSGRAERAGVVAAADLSADLPEFDPKRLKLVSVRGCSVVQSLPAVVRMIEEGEYPRSVVLSARRLLWHATELHPRLSAHVPPTKDAPTAAFRLAERYEAVFAGAAVLWFAVHNRTDGPLWNDWLWVRACLGQVLRDLGEWPGGDAGQATDELARLVASTPEGRLSLLAEENS